MKSVSLNLFQRLLRQWDRVHPYNAGQIMHLRGTVDLDRASKAWHEAMQSLGLGSVRVTGDRYAYETPTGHWHNRPILHVRCDGDLPGFLSEQLNKPFTDPDEPPFRPFLVTCEGTCRLGVIYQHWLADSVSIRMLMREWFYRLYDPARATAGRVTIAKKGYWRLFGPHASNWSFVLGTINTYRRYFRYRRVMKVNTPDINDTVVHVQLNNLPCLMGHVAAYAKQHGVKVNDIFGAAMAELCARHVPLQKRGKRKDIAIGSVVDLRPLTNTDLRNVFGIFLGFSSVVCTPRDRSNWDSLLRSVATQNRITREMGITQTSLIWMHCALSLGHLQNPKRLYRFYRKDIPLSAGVSNVNLNATWVGQYHPDPILSYERISPAGPMTPIVFSTTTLGSNLQVSVTFRRGLVDDARVAEMFAGFAQRLSSLTSPPIQGE